MTASIDHGNVSAASLSEMVSHLLRSPISHAVEDGSDSNKTPAPIRASQSSSSLHAHLPQPRTSDQYNLYSAQSHQPLQAASHDNNASNGNSASTLRKSISYSNIVASNRGPSISGLLGELSISAQPPAQSSSKHASPQPNAAGNHSNALHAPSSHSPATVRHRSSDSHKGPMGQSAPQPLLNAHALNTHNTLVKPNYNVQQHRSKDAQSFTSDNSHHQQHNHNSSTGTAQTRRTASQLRHTPNPLYAGYDDDNAAVLFVGDLARTINEDEMKDIFNQYGAVVHVDIKRDKVTGNNLGYGFVQFDTRESAKEAKHHLQDQEIHGRRIRLGWAVKNSTLFIGDLDGKITTDQLIAVFQEFGPINVDGTFVKDGSKYGFVEFRNRHDAEVAKATMNKRVVGTRPIRIGWGESALQKCCVHIQFDAGQGQYLTENDFRPVFSPYGSIVTITMPKPTPPPSHNRRQNHVPSANSQKAYAFIHYEDTDAGEDAATAAINDLQDTSLRGVPLHLSYGKRQIYSKHKRSQQQQNQQQPNGAAPVLNGPSSHHLSQHLPTHLQNSAHLADNASTGSAATSVSIQPQNYNSNTGYQHRSSGQPLLDNPQSASGSSQPLVYNTSTGRPHTINRGYNTQQHQQYNSNVSGYYNNTRYDQNNHYSAANHLLASPANHPQHQSHVPPPIHTQLPTPAANGHFNFDVSPTGMTTLHHQLSDGSPSFASQTPRYYLPHLDQTPQLTAQRQPSSPHFHLQGSQQQQQQWYAAAMSSPHHTGYAPIQLARQGSDTLSIISHFNTPLMQPTPLFTPNAQGLVPYPQLMWQTSTPALLPLEPSIAQDDGNSQHTHTMQMPPYYQQQHQYGYQSQQPALQHPQSIDLHSSHQKTHSLMSATSSDGVTHITDNAAPATSDADVPVQNSILQLMSKSQKSADTTNTAAMNGTTR